MKLSLVFQRLIIVVAAGSAVIGLILTLAIGWGIYQDTRQKKQAAYEFAAGQADLLTAAIDAEMQAEMALATGLAKQLSSGELSYEQAAESIASAFDQKPGLQGIAVAFEPYVYNAQTRLFAPYFIKDGTGQVKRIQVEDIYDYTNTAIATAQWYYKAIVGNDGVWRGAYYGQAADDLLIVYSVPFQSPQKPAENAGVVVVAHSATDTFKRLMQSVDLGQGGYAFIINADGMVAYHPEADLLGVSLEDAAAHLGNNALLSAVQEASGGEKAQFSGKMGMGAETGWFFVNPMAISGWKLVVAINEKLLTYDAAALIRPRIQVALVFTLFLAGFLIVVLRVDKETPVRLMSFSVSLGCVFVAVILWVWYLEYTNPELNHQSVVINATDIQRLIEPMAQRLRSVNAGEPIQIPTGIVIENLTLSNQTAKISGYIWQRYPADMPEELIDFPQLTDQIGGLSRRETYRGLKHGALVVGWFFSTEIQQRFDVSDYPLDQAFVKIKIEPARLSDKYVLVPDIQEYAFMGPAHKPGLSDELRVRGWNVTNSYFSYEQDSYGTQFGIFQRIQKDYIPILNFNVRLNRDIISPVIAYCIVLYVVLIQVYGLAILNIENAFQVLSIASALFLVSAISHNALRDMLAATGLVYLEYFFVLLYITILFTTVNAISRVMSIKIPLLSDHDNLLIKILFWPAYLGIGLIITLLHFYPF
jgi:hypothetical protein